MTASSALTYAAALTWAATTLTPNCDSPRREAEVLLLHVLQITRSHLHAWPERLLTPAQQTAYADDVQRFLQGEPVAYITGHREFWSLDLLVTSDTLIPRPETELLVECVLATFTTTEPRVIADLGTGSGAIALAVATERPNWQVHASDRMQAALAVAQLNADRLKITNITFHLGDWCAALPAISFDAIISNPPYIAAADPAICPLVAASEPHAALFADQEGLYDLSIIIESAKRHLKSGGYLLVEHGATQAKQVKQLFEKSGYTKINLHTDLAGKDRVTSGQV